MGKIKRAIQFLASHDALTPEVAESMLNARDWEESQHPRDKDGKFTAGGGGGGGSGSEGSSSSNVLKYDRPGKVEHLDTLKKAPDNSKVSFNTPQGKVSYTKSLGLWFNDNNPKEYKSDKEMQKYAWGSEADVVTPNKQIGGDLGKAIANAKNGDRVKTGNFDFVFHSYGDDGSWGSNEGKFGALETGKRYSDKMLAEKFGATGWSDPDGREMQIGALHVYPNGEVQLLFNSKTGLHKNMYIEAKNMNEFAEKVGGKSNSGKIEFPKTQAEIRERATNDIQEIYPGAEDIKFNRTNNYVTFSVSDKKGRTEYQYHIDRSSPLAKGVTHKGLRLEFVGSTKKS